MCRLQLKVRWVYKCYELANDGAHGNGSKSENVALVLHRMKVDLPAKRQGPGGASQGILVQQEHDDTFVYSLSSAMNQAVILITHHH